MAHDMSQGELAGLQFEGGGVIRDVEETIEFAQTGVTVGVGFKVLWEETH